MWIDKSKAAISSLEKDLDRLKASIEHPDGLSNSTMLPQVDWQKFWC